MSYGFAKWLAPMFEPLSFVFLGLVLLTFRLLWRRRIRSALVLALLTGCFWLLSATPLSAWLLAGLERPYARTEWKSLPESDAVVLLGGLLNFSVNDPLGFEVGHTFDRALAAVEMVRLGKARNFVMCGAGNPNDPGKTEFHAITRWIAENHLVNIPVHGIGISANTIEEAEKVGALAKERGWKQILLVTSAFHMRRSEGLFKRQGLTVIPVACDFRGIPQISSGGAYYFFPRMKCLFDMDSYLHEWTGLMYCRIKGLI